MPAHSSAGPLPPPSTVSLSPRLSLSWHLPDGCTRTVGGQPWASTAPGDWRVTPDRLTWPEVPHVASTCRSHAVCSPPPTVGRLGARTFTRGQQLLTFHEAGQGVPCGAHGAGCGLPFSGAVLTGQHWVRCLCLWVGETTFPASEGPGGQASRKLSSFPPWPPGPITDSHLAGTSTGFTLIPVLKWWSDAIESIPSLYR